MTSSSLYPIITLYSLRFLNQLCLCYLTQLWFLLLVSRSGLIDQTIFILNNAHYKYLLVSVVFFDKGLLEDSCFYSFVEYF